MKLQKGQNHKILIILLQVLESHTNYATIKKKLLFTKNASSLTPIMSNSISKIGRIFAGKNHFIHYITSEDLK